MEPLLLYYLFLCCVCIAIVGGIIWLARRGRSTRPAPEPAASELRTFVAFDRLVAGWVAAGRLDAASAARVRDLIAEDWAAVAPGGEPAPLTPPPAPAPRAARPAPVQHFGSPLPVLTADDQAATTAGQAGGRSSVVGGPSSQAGTNFQRAQLVAALLSLGTRRTLLFLGTFLLIMSSLTLVIFSWASLPPLVQLAILAGTTGAIWAGGAWMARRPELATAGRNLQAVAALLMPVVGFALGRPGLLDLAPRPAWQLASAVSLGAYLLAAWRTRRPWYSGVASLAAASLLLAALGTLEPGWQLVPLMALLATLLPLAGFLRRAGESGLSAGPRWVAIVGGPLTLLVAALLYGVERGGYAFAAALAVGAGFCVLAYRLERRGAWLWAAVALLPAALQVALSAADAAPAVRACALAGLALGYLGLCAWREGHGQQAQPALAARPPAAALPPLFAGAIGLALLTLPLALSALDAARLALPPLVLLGSALTVLVERGRLAWLVLRIERSRRVATTDDRRPTTAGHAAEPKDEAPPNHPVAPLQPMATVTLRDPQVRITIATGGLAAAAALFALWLGAVLELWFARGSVIGLALLPLAGCYFAAARWWPGRLRARYDQALQVVAVLVTLAAGGATLLDLATRLPGALLVAVIFAGQAAVRRGAPWAAISLAAAALASAFAVERFVAPDDRLRAATMVALGLAAAYSLGGERLRRSVLRYWAWPAVVLGAAGGALAGLLALLQLGASPALCATVLLALAGLLGAHTALWRRAALGYGAAPLLVLAALVAAGEGFFTGWQPAAGDLAYLVCALSLGLALLGQALRRSGRAYALPYELAAFALLPAAPLLAGGDLAHLTITWAALALLYGAALLRYRLPWMLGLAFVCLDFAVLFGSAWRLPGGDPAAAGLLLSVTVAAQALFSAWARRRGVQLSGRPLPVSTTADRRLTTDPHGARPSSVVGPRSSQPGRDFRDAVLALLGHAGLWGYLSAALGAFGALLLAAGGAGYAAAAAGVLAVTMVALVWAERREEPAWASLGLALIGAWFWHLDLGLAPVWAAAWLVLELVGVSVAGWAAAWGGLAVWRRPTTLGAVGAAALVTAAVAGLALGLALPALTFALASLGLLLATVAVRERELWYAYGAGAAVVGAALCQLVEWGFSEAQWYAVPAGLYLLSLAWGLRRFQGRRIASQIVEGAGVLLLLGVSFGQFILVGGAPYGLLLFGESLAVAAYGALTRLRAPFLGGVGFFVAGVSWMTLDTVLLVNQWVLLGAVGLLMVLAYVILERHQERLVRAGRHWMTELQSWG